MAVLHFGAGRMVAGPSMLRIIPASSRQRRTSCLDETVISSAVSNSGKGPEVRTYGSSVIGIRKSVINTTLDNFGDGRRFSHPDGCQTRGRRSPTGNQQWLAIARGSYFSGPHRSLHQRSDRSGRSSTHHQRTRSQPHQQTHLSEMGYVPSTGGQTLSCPRMASEIACGSKDQRPYSGSHVSALRKGHALGTDSP